MSTIKLDECFTCGHYIDGFCNYEGCCWIPRKPDQQGRKQIRQNSTEGNEMDTITITFKQMSMICEKRVSTSAWYDAGTEPPYDESCTFDINNMHECKQEECPFWRRFSTEGVTR